MRYKTTTGGRFKLVGDDAGKFTAVFSRFNVIDKDGDVTLPGAFEEGEAVKIAAWGHAWQSLPAGKGAIHADDIEAWVDGQFFLDTAVGMETYTTVKNLGELQEWSFGFDLLADHPGQFQGQKVRFLERLKVHEVSPVFLAAGIGTRTTSIKGAAGGDVLMTLAKIQGLQTGTVEEYLGFYPAGALGIIDAQLGPGALAAIIDDDLRNAELQDLEGRVKSAEARPTIPTNLDVVRRRWEKFDGGGHPALWVRAQVEADANGHVDRLLELRPDLGSRQDAEAIIGRWLRSPARRSAVA